MAAFRISILTIKKWPVFLLMVLFTYRSINIKLSLFRPTNIKI